MGQEKNCLMSSVRITEKKGRFPTKALNLNSKSFLFHTGLWLCQLGGGVGENLCLRAKDMQRNRWGSWVPWLPGTRAVWLKHRSVLGGTGADCHLLKVKVGDSGKTELRETHRKENEVFHKMLSLAQGSILDGKGKHHNMERYKGRDYLALNAF